MFLTSLVSMIMGPCLLKDLTWQINCQLRVMGKSPLRLVARACNTRVPL